VRSGAAGTGFGGLLPRGKQPVLSKSTPSRPKPTQHQTPHQPPTPTPNTNPQCTPQAHDHTAFQFDVSDDYNSEAESAGDDAALGGADEGVVMFGVSPCKDG